MTSLTVTIDTNCKGAILAPIGIATPYEEVDGVSVQGGLITDVLPEPELGLSAILVQPDGPEVTLTYRVTPNPRNGAYPEVAFKPRRTRHTQAAQPLVEASRAIADSVGGGRAGIEAIVAEAQARFAYAHPDQRFTDGLDEVPLLSCGLTEGSCVDINTYLVASLRAAGYEAAYFYGYFFPKERGGMTDDGHCWVATRHDGEVLEWDIAHHIKAGLGPTRPALNPRPGARIAVTHSMDHRYLAPTASFEPKVLGEPMRLAEGGTLSYVSLTARLSPVFQRKDAA